MTDFGTPWIMLAAGVPLLGAALLSLRALDGHRRFVALAVSAGQLVVCAIATVVYRAQRTPEWVDPWATSLPQGLALFRLDPVSAPLLPLVAGIGFVTVLTRPRRREHDGFFLRALLTESLLVAVFTCRHTPSLVLLWWGLSLLPLLELRAAAGERITTGGLEAAGLIGSALLFSVGVALVPGRLEAAGVVLIVLGILCRAGMFPFQSWVPQFFARVPPGPAMLALAPQVAAYSSAILLLPYGRPWVSLLLGVPALVTAVHAAALALVQRDARRALAWLFLSQSAGVFAGMASGTEEGMAGGLTIWISCAVAGSGLALALWALEARRGRLDLERSHGGYDRMPFLASSFLLMGLALVGFPGTLGFVGEELLVDGSIGAGPFAGLVILLAGAVNGITLLRMYFRLFCGTRARTPAEQRLRPRERLGFAAIVMLLILGGLAPRAIVDSRAAAAGSITPSPPPPPGAAESGRYR